MAQTLFSHQGKRSGLVTGGPSSSFHLDAKNLSPQPQFPHLSNGIILSDHESIQGLGTRHFCRASWG